MASGDFVQEKAFLTYLMQGKVKNQTHAVLENINLKQSKVISGIFLNFLKGNCSNTDKIIARNKRFKDIIREIGSPNQPLSKRRHLIQLHKSKVSAVLKDLSEDIEVLLTENEKIPAGGGGEISKTELNPTTDSDSKDGGESADSDEDPGQGQGQGQGDNSGGEDNL